MRFRKGSHNLYKVQRKTSCNELIHCPAGANDSREQPQQWHCCPLQQYRIRSSEELGALRGQGRRLSLVYLLATWFRCVGRRQLFPSKIQLGIFHIHSVVEARLMEGLDVAEAFHPLPSEIVDQHVQRLPSMPRGVPMGMSKHNHLHQSRKLCAWMQRRNADLSTSGSNFGTFSRSMSIPGKDNSQLIISRGF